MPKLDIKAIAKQTKGRLVVATTTTIDVYFQDKYHVEKNTPTLKLPVVFSGKLNEVEAWAKTNDFKRKVDKDSLFGIYYSDDHGNTYILG